MNLALWIINTARIVSSFAVTARPTISTSIAGIKRVRCPEKGRFWIWSRSKHTIVAGCESMQLERTVVHDDTTNIIPDDPNEIVVSADIQLPFSAEIAYDAFADLSRHSSWSPWLVSIEYVDGSDAKNGKLESKSTMQCMGIKFSSKALYNHCRPRSIEWASTKSSFLQNRGLVEFKSYHKDLTHMKLSMTFTLPPYLSKFMTFQKRQRVEDMVGNGMLESTLTNFREDIMRNDFNMTKLEVEAVLRAL